MIFYKRILGFVLAFIFAIILEIVYYNPKFFLYGALLTITFLLFYFWRIKNRFVRKLEILSYFLIIFAFLLSLWCFFIVSDNFYIRTMVLIFSVYFLMILFDSFFKKIYENKEISNEIIKSMDIICFLLFVFFSFYILIFISLSIVLSCLFILFISFLCLIIRFYWEKINWKKNKLSIITASLILTEIYLVMAFLPFNVYFLTFITWLWYYLISEFLIDELKQQSTAKKKINLFVIFLSVLVISFLTAIIKY